MSDQDFNKAMTQALSVYTGRRWCASCQSSRAVEGGIWKPTSTYRKVWYCRECFENQQKARKGRR